jgi:hypothetical protein
MGLCIFSLESHQRSWWIRSYPAYREPARARPNPTNAVGGSFTQPEGLPRSFAGRVSFTNGAHGI